MTAPSPNEGQQTSYFVVLYNGFTKSTAPTLNSWSGVLYQLTVIGVAGEKSEQDESRNRRNCLAGREIVSCSFGNRISVKIGICGSTGIIDTFLRAFFSGYSNGSSDMPAF